MKYTRLTVPKYKCVICGKELSGRKKVYCSKKCTGISITKRRRLGKRIDQNRQIILSIFDNKCSICNSKKDLVIHHKIPVSRGGTNHIGNVIALCKICHKNIHQGIFNKCLEEALCTKEKL